MPCDKKGMKAEAAKAPTSPIIQGLISTENKQKVAVRILNLNTGETYTGRLAITGNHQLYLPTEIQKMPEGAGRIRIQLV